MLVVRRLLLPWKLRWQPLPLWLFWVPLSVRPFLLLLLPLRRMPRATDTTLLRCVARGGGPHSTR
jgi:hypothetical protein